MLTQHTSRHQHRQSGGVFFQVNPGGNIIIQDGQFIQSNCPSGAHNCCDADDGFKHLQAHVATTAFDSEQECDVPKCHPNTREAVLSEIMDYILMNVTQMQYILWFYGAAGAGKSAIARSIVQLCIESGIPIARFFFLRNDSTRNTIKPVVATLVHQLIRYIPDLENIIVSKIQSDPLIFTKSLASQFDCLIFGPLQQLQPDLFPVKLIVLLIDGLDECDGDENQVNLIAIITKFVTANSFPLLVLFCSRAETQIRTQFRSPHVAGVTHLLPLDDNYLPDHDIHLFLDDNFATIKTTHTFNHLLDIDWPSSLLVDEIVTKSSGQFIYASVVVKFVSDPRSNPYEQLEIVRGLRPSGNLTPFAQLDGLYRHIFSRVQNISRATQILVHVMLSNEQNIGICAHLLGITKADIHIALGDLVSVICCDAVNIRFLHASLADFLLDKSRSNQYFVDKTVWAAKFSLNYFNRAKSGLYISHLFIFHYLPHAECTHELREAITSMDPYQLNAYFGSINIWPIYLTAIKSLDFGDNGRVYQNPLYLITRFFQENWPKKLSKLQENHNISNILEELEAEKETRKSQKQNQGKGIIPFIKRLIYAGCRN